MSENMAYAVQFGIFAMVVLGATAAGLVYVKTEGEHGGFVALILGIIAISIGGGLWDQAQAVIG